MDRESSREIAARAAEVGFDALDQALALVTPGGFSVVDDLLPQPNWPAEHQAGADGLLAVRELMGLD
ncbi:hypothetical protein [Nocardioides astragali]|uniref:Uncharacterized protein n=1 Tax=Nocardioides astragali TaxID=1776736 RepID=A0ABW2MY45_9ACTN|nr:hypothetical protein [Nocardioides astragali]